MHLISKLGEQEEDEEDLEDLEDVNLERVASAIHVLAEQVLSEREAYVKVIFSRWLSTYGNVDMALVAM